jgi:hypothetical protein
VKLLIGIYLAAVLVCLADEFGLACIFPGPVAQRVLEPGLKAAGMDAQTATHHTHR